MFSLPDGSQRVSYLAIHALLSGRGLVLIDKPLSGIRSVRGFNLLKGIHLIMSVSD